MSEERKRILDMVGSGQISPEQGAALLELVTAPDEEETAQAEEKQPSPAEETQVVAAHAPAYALWVDPLGAGTPSRVSGTSPRVLGGVGGAGLVLLLVGGTVVSAMHQQQRVNAWTWLCGWIPLFVGLSVVTLAAWARTAHWIHLRVRDHGEHVALSFPLPLGLAAAVVRVARPFVPRLRDTAIDEAILAVRDGLQGNEDITIDVQDDEEGESVQIDFGGHQ
jgi:hypothetical protein